MSISRKEKKSSCTKRSSYVLGLVDHEDILTLNGIPIIPESIYIIPRKKTEEADALLAIYLPTYENMLSSAHLQSEDNIYKCVCKNIQSIREHAYLQYIVDAKHVYIKNSYTVQRIVIGLIEDGWDNQYILLNIEPKGLTGELERVYPAPLITLPGGTMESSDNGDFEYCAFREFFEETGIKIEKCNYICIAKDKLKCSKHTSHHVYTFEKKHKTLPKQFQMSWYFSIKLMRLKDGISPLFFTK